MPQDTLVRESFDFSGGTVDETGPFPVIRGVLICGDASKWGYDYLRESWTDETLKAYEGISSYANHVKGNEQPDVENKVGWFENIRRRPDGRPEGDYCLFPTHELTPRLILAAKHNPRAFAMSHRAHVKWGERNGKRVVEGITKPISVDVVGDGATTGGLFESAPPTGRKPVPTVKEYLNKLGPKLSINQLIRAKTLVKEDAYGAAPMPDDAPPADAEATDADDGIDSAFLAVAMKEIKECMDAKGEPKKLKACLGRLKKILMTHGELSADDSDPDEEETETEEGTAKEGAPKSTLLDDLVAEAFTPTASQLTALKGIKTQPDRIAFIREQKGLAAATSPKSTSREQLAASSQKNGTVKEGAPAGGGTPPSGVEEAAGVMDAIAKKLRGLPTA